MRCLYPARPSRAIGKPSRPVITSIVATGLFGLILWWRLPIDGLIGAGLAYLAMAAATVVFSAAWAVQSLAGRSAIAR